MNHSSLGRVAGIMLATVLVCTAQADWARFRGSAGGGIGVAPELPSGLTEKNCRWTTVLPGGGHASPVVWGSRVFDSLLFICHLAMGG